MKHLLLRHQHLKHWLSAPFILPLIIPLIILDLWVEIYHRVCFPLYKMPYIKRKNYIKIDRYKLAYLNPLQKIFCAYCGYANGVIHFWTKIAADTENYWCGIQHQKDPNFNPPKHHENFAEYGNEKEFNEKYLKQKLPIKK